uniref:Alpha-2-macroglobulin domain-containing protein n=1 Tax=Anopheles melas TaxID=34690 RepID=A0A182TP91_9DIPT
MYEDQQDVRVKVTFIEHYTSITGKVEVFGIGFGTTVTSDNDGLVKLELQPSEGIESIDVRFYLSIDEYKFKPGRQIELSMYGRPGAYVGLAAYGKALLLFNKNHDLSWEDFLKVFDGFHTIAENDYDQMHTVWYPMGFSIDPVYGLGIIKKPIELTTVQPFFILECLPYSIKLNEAIEIQFILISNLQEEYTVDVTLYNENNDMEFIGRSISSRYQRE